MKKKFISFSFVFIVMLIGGISSCDLGLDSGVDMTGKWSYQAQQYLGYTDAKTEIFSFNSDGTGTYEYHSGNVDRNSNITYSVSKGSGLYKKLSVNDSGTTDYEYYFSADKNTLYLKDLSMSIQSFNTYKKQ